MKRVVGVDLGSRTTAIVELGDGEVRHGELFETGIDPLPRVQAAVARLGAAEIVATGDGRHLLRTALGARCVTEIKAAARGARQLFPGCRVVLDVGGQDCKAIGLAPGGAVAEFHTNDRCAAGTGRFLEVMAQRFGLPLAEFCRLALAAGDHIPINSMCTVFAESEVVSLIAADQPRPRIARGLHVSAAAQIAALARRIAVAGEVVFIGGGALNDCLHALLEQELGTPIRRPEQPQLAVALGAALAAAHEPGSSRPTTA